MPCFFAYVLNFMMHIITYMAIFVHELFSCTQPLEVDELIILQYLLHHAEGETGNLAVLCQRDEARIKDILSKMEQHDLVERGGTGRGTYWTLKPKIHELLVAPGHPNFKRSWKCR